PDPPAPSLVSINAVPWGNVFVDGRAIGNTPLVDIPISAGRHEILVQREGYVPYDRIVDLSPHEQMRLTEIVLRAVTR
ncbi:MAG: PEGA domain-containing protein, partial [Gemmatimonadales bacterium]